VFPRSPTHRTPRLGNPRKLIWSLGVLLVALFAAIGVEGSRTWKAYGETFGARDASKDWLSRKLTSYSVDTYEELLAIKRLQIYCLRFAQGSMDIDDFNIHRRQVIGSFATFKPGTLIEKEISAHESFAPAWTAVQAFLDAARELEEGKQKIGPVFDIGEEAAAAWGKLAGDAITREFEQRDGMEKAIVEFRPIAVRSFVVISILLALCAIAIAAAGYAAHLAWQAERRRFDRFELILATVGHDLRSPLQALVGAAKLAAADAVPAEREKFVNIVHERSAFFTRLLDDLIDLSRSTSLSFVPVHVDLAAWFDVATSRYRQAVEAKGLAFSSALHVQYSPILFDAHRLTQCADNLVFNAIRFTDEGSVDFKVRTVMFAGNELRLEIEVSDTGRGIDPSDQGRIFEPFVRVEQSHAGMGLGLSMVASLASSLGGRAHVVRSAPGYGSTFLFSVPVERSQLAARNAREEPLRSVPVAADAVDHKSTGVTVPRVLVIDDDPLITQVVSALLPHMGFDADVAVGGHAGLKMAAERSYCAVITDIQMPEVDGFELAKALRHSGQPCPMLIALTAYTAREDVADRAGVFDALLRKPFDELELAELLDRAAIRWSSTTAA
jgi:signal transduction histidine kinase/CheY-like chemotaxis protein